MIPGLKASKLIEKLQKLIDKYGDQEVVNGGGDYPDGVQGVYRQKTEDPYITVGSFVVR